MGSERYVRVGAIFGIAFVVLVFITFFLPSTPEIDDPIAEAIAAVQDDEDGLWASVYVGGLSGIAFFPFLGALYGLLRRPDGRPDAFAVAALAAGTVTTAGVLLSDGVVASLVESVNEGFDPSAVEALLALDNTLFLGTAFSFAAFFGAVAVAVLGTRALPAWLGWVAAVAGALIVVGLLGVFSDDDEGGAVGVLVFIGFLLGLAWTLATSIVMLMRRPAATPA